MNNKKEYIINIIICVVFVLRNTFLWEQWSWSILHVSTSSISNCAVVQPATDHWDKKITDSKDKKSLILKIS